MVNARFLLDTNALSEPIRLAPNPAFLRKFELHRHVLAIPAPVWHEALFGLLRMPLGRHRDRVADYLHSVIRPTVEVLPYDEEAANWHASERSRLFRAGTALPFADGQIAAVAARFKVPLVTDNTPDFERFVGIQLENWMERPGE